MPAGCPSWATDALPRGLPAVADEKTSSGPPRPREPARAPLSSRGTHCRRHRDHAPPEPEAESPAIRYEPEDLSPPPDAMDCRDSTRARPATMTEPPPSGARAV